MVAFKLLIMAANWLVDQYYYVKIVKKCKTKNKNLSF